MTEQRKPLRHIAAERDFGPILTAASTQELADLAPHPARQRRPVTRSQPRQSQRYEAQLMLAEALYEYAAVGALLPLGTSTRSDPGHWVAAARRGGAAADRRSTCSLSAPSRARGVADEVPVGQRRQVCVGGREPVGVWLLHVCIANDTLHTGMSLCIYWRGARFEERGGSRLEACSRASTKDEECLETERLPANRLAKGVTLVVATKARFERADITTGADSTCGRIGCVRLSSARRHVCLGRNEARVLGRHSKGSHHRPEQPVRSERHDLRRVRVGLNDQRGAQRALHPCQP